MQDRYSGDVGDFGKFSLLQCLFGNSQDRIGVIWYLFPNETHNDDGGHIDYLTNRDFLDCDKHLCEKLSRVVHGNRSVAALEKAGLLSANTVYFSEILDFHRRFPSQTRKDQQEREDSRKQWIARAVKEVSKCNVLFLDPDNGLQISSCSKTSQIKSGKFTFYPEISELMKDKDILVVYHHLSRNGTHENQISIKASMLRRHIAPTGRIFAIRFRPYSPRAYFIITDRSAENRVRQSLSNFMQSEYSKHWDSYYEDAPF
jgi:hypothetical protein